MDNIGILHLSDIHFCQENKETIIQLLDRLKTDLSNICSNEQLKIRLICITGDLINSGFKHDEEFKLFQEHFYLPLLSFLHLDGTSVFIVPGNHEIDTKQINKYAEQGFSTMLIDSESICSIMSDEDSSALTRIEYFQNVADQLSTSPMKYRDNFCRCYQVNIEGINFGLACLNSAWRSSGKGSIERGKMIIGLSQVEAALNHLNDSEIKICLAHHPLDWLIECDKYDIEKAFSGFDIVLNGHIHALDSKTIIAYNGNTLINTCGKFFPTNDAFNGYSIISINKDTHIGNVYLRQYYQGRNCFDKCLQLYDEGRFEFNLSVKDSSLMRAFEITHDLQPGFLEFADSFFISNFITSYTKKSLEEAFIIPPLGKKSEYQKETMSEIDDYKTFNRSSGFYTMEFLLSETSRNLLIFGKKEYGKTTLIHYMVSIYLKHFNDYGVVPIIIDCSRDFKGKYSIEKESEKFIIDFGSKSLTIKLDDVIDLAKNGLCTFFFDNFETVTSKELSKIKNFVDTYPNNRFIFSAIETIDLEQINQSIDEILSAVTRVYIHALGKHQIRNLAENLLDSQISINENIIDKTMLCFRNTNLPKTPFVVSLVLSICKENTDFVPINESVVMENFLETVLEKTSNESAKTSSYDYKIKEDFLCYLVGQMHERNQYWFTKQEFELVSQTYHTNKGWAKSDTHFDSLFIDKGILYEHADIVAFRYSCMANFYLAKLALKVPQLLTHILYEDNYLNYYYELNYLTGLQRDSKDVLAAIEPRFQAFLQEHKAFKDTLQNYEIKTNFALPPSNFSGILTERFTLDQSDIVADDQQYSKVTDSSIIHRNEEEISTISSKEKFLGCLVVYATILKNCELYDADTKQEMLSGLVDGLCIALGIFKQTLEDNRPKIIKDIERKATSSPDKKALSAQEIESLFEDTAKIALPIAIENIAFETAGSAKLKNIILPLIQSDELTNSFPQCILLFLYCDLRISGCLKELRSFVNKTSSKDLLTISFFKVLYYYKMRYFPSSQDSIIENLLADINLKLHNMNKFQKDQVLKNIQKERRVAISGIE